MVQRENAVAMPLTGTVEAGSRAFYDGIAADYDRLLDTPRARGMRDCFWRRVEAMLPRPSRILDFGAGTGAVCTCGLGFELHPAAVTIIPAAATGSHARIVMLGTPARTSDCRPSWCKPDAPLRSPPTGDSRAGLKAASRVARGHRFQTYGQACCRPLRLILPPPMTSRRVCRQNRERVERWRNEMAEDELARELLGQEA